MNVRVRVYSMFVSVLTCLRVCEYICGVCPCERRVTVHREGVCVNGMGVFCVYGHVSVCI